MPTRRINTAGRGPAAKTLTATMFAVVFFVVTGCELDRNLVTADPPPTDWPVVARVAGAALDIGDESYEHKRMLDDFVDQNVSVIEADSRLSEYLDETEFGKELDLMARFADMAHERNLKVVWYYPTLEVITPNGETAEHSMFKDHPDWVQLGIDNTDPTKFPPNVFYGSKVFWVDPGAESAWMDPHTGYRQYYMERIKKIAASGIDGIWLDVPLYNDIVGRWASQHQVSRSKFKSDTGMELPGPVNLSDVGETPYYDLDANDPVFKVWLNWRHHQIDEFLKDVYSAARSVNPDFQVIVETVTMDYNAAVLEGLDGAFAGPLDGYWHVWEVDVLSDTNAMVNSMDNDWYSLAAMYKFGRGADRGRAAWAFTYGWAPDDAEAVLFQAVAAQINPYELKIPEMTTTVGHEYRKRVFGFLKENEDDIFRSTSAAKVAVLHSSASRDYTDSLCITGEGGVCGVSLFSSWERPDPEMAWWTDNPNDSVNAAQYMGEYRGTVKALMNAHVPFDVLPSRLQSNESIDKYDLIYLPWWVAASDAEIAMVENFVDNGGTAFISGSEAVVMDEKGDVRDSRPQWASASESGCAEYPSGNGRFIRCAGNPGRLWLTDEDENALASLSTPIPFAAALIETDAKTDVSLDLYSRGNRIILHAVNHSGADGSWSVEPQIFNVTIDVGDRTVSALTAKSARTGTSAVKFTQNGNKVTFLAKVQVHTMWVVELQ